VLGKCLFLYKEFIFMNNLDKEKKILELMTLTYTNEEEAVQTVEFFRF
jgi:hypothetical protein